MPATDGLRPWAHGIAVSSDDSDLFTGRARALRAVAEWLGRSPADPGALVVTGAPGSGKSALLARVWREHTFDVAVNAHGQTSGEVLRALCAAVGCEGTRPADLVSATRGRPLLALIDGVDEAADAVDLWDALLSPLTRLDPGSGIRLLLGMCQPVPERLSGSARVVDLDADEYHDPGAIIEYAARYLRANLPRATAEEITELSATAAAAAGASFFTAHVIVRNLADRGQVQAPLWRAALPGSPADAVSWDLRSRLSPMDLARAEDLLAPLAFALGGGLPWEDVWAPAAASASGRPYDDADLGWLRRELGSYIHEVVDTRQLRYRLCHEIVARHLRTSRDAASTHAAIASALVRRVPRGVGVVHDWTEADTYALTHLATHAAAGGVLDGLLADPGYLLRAARPSLLAALPTAGSAEARAAAEAYRAVAAELTRPPRPEHVSRLELVAHGAGATALATEIRRSRMPRPWATRWAAWSVAPRPRTLAGGHAGAVLAVATVRAEQGLLAVTGGEDGTVRVWDVTAGHPVGPPLPAPAGAVRTMAACRWRGRSIAVTAGDGAVYRWDLATGDVVAVPVTRGDLTTVALAQLGGRCVLVAGTAKGLVCTWDLLDGVPLAELPAHAGAVRALAIGAVAGLANAVVSIGMDSVARVWDLNSGRPLGPALLAPAGTVAAALVDGRPAALTVDRDRTIRVWDLGTGRTILDPFAGNTSDVAAAALSEGDPCTVVSASIDGRVLAWRLTVPPATPSIRAPSVLVCEAGRVWVGDVDGSVRCVDGGTGMLLGTPAMGHDGPVTAAAAAVIDTEPVLLTGGVDGQIRSWSRLSGLPSLRRWAGTGSHAIAIAAAGRGIPAVAVPHAVALVAGGTDTADLWDVTTGIRLCRLARQRDACATAMVVAAGRPFVVTGSARGVVALWDLSVGRHQTVTRPVAVLGQHGGPVTAMAATADGFGIVVVSGGADRTAMRWLVDVSRAVPRARRAPDGQSLLRVDGPVTAVACQPTRSRVPFCAVAADGAVHVWEPNGEALRVHLDERVTALGLAGDVVVIGTDRGVAAVQPHTAGQLV